MLKGVGASKNGSEVASFEVGSSEKLVASKFVVSKLVTLKFEVASNSAKVTPK